MYFKFNFPFTFLHQYVGTVIYCLFTKADTFSAIPEKNIGKKY